MIPKLMHYCWFGRNPIPLSVQNCIDSWRHYCPDYDLTLWTEDNFDINSHPYMEEAYNTKKYAFVSDLARLLIIYNHGGIYLDTDVELIKSLDDIVNNNRFFFAIEKDTNIITGEESIHVATGLGFGAEAGNQVVKSMIDEYEDAHFILTDGTFDQTPCPVRNSKALEQYGWTGKDEMLRFESGIIYPSEYFCPEEFSSDIKRYTENTISIHHYDASWKTNREKIIGKMKMNVKKMLRIFGGGYSEVVLMPCFLSCREAVNASSQREEVAA